MPKKHYVQKENQNIYVIEENSTLKNFNSPGTVERGTTN